MDTDPVPGALLIIGSLVFGVGASIGVPRVFTERDPQARLRLIQGRLGRWRFAQPFYAFGPLIAAAGVGGLAAATPGGSGRIAFAAACMLMVVGVVAWCNSLYARATRIADFAFGRLPGWPFVTYVLLTIAGLVLLGVGLIDAGFPVWLGWLTLGAALLFLAIYAWSRDIPPFVFYVLLLVVGSVVI